MKIENERMNGRMKKEKEKKKTHIHASQINKERRVWCFELENVIPFISSRYSHSIGSLSPYRHSHVQYRVEYTVYMYTRTYVRTK